MSEFASYPSLNGRPVIISGGASGIGEGIVREFAAQGSKVGFVDIAADAGRKLEAELTAPRARPSSSPRCDITDIPAYQSAIRGSRPRTARPWRWSTTPPTTSATSGKR